MPLRRAKSLLFYGKYSQNPAYSKYLCSEQSMKSMARVSCSWPPMNQPPCKEIEGGLSKLFPIEKAYTDTIGMGKLK